MKAKDVMTHSVVTIKPDAAIHDAIVRMVSHAISGMPVVASSRLVGRDSKRRIDQANGHGPSEAANLVSIAHDPRYRTPRRCALGRHLFDEVERRALHVLSENVHGVWAVDDRMVCIEPMSGVGPSERAAQVATFP